MIKRVAFLILCSTIFSVSTFGAATINGPTGLIEVPTAESLKYKEYNIVVDYNLSSDNSDVSALFYKANLGTFRGWELGIVGGEVPSEGVFVNAKYYLMSDNSQYPLSLALGMENLTSAALTNFYLVGTKLFSNGIHGHMGFKAHLSGDLDASVMGGLEYFLDDQLSLLSDINGDRRIYKVNAGLRYLLSPDCMIRLAVIDIGSSHTAGTLFSFGVSFTGFL
ncbi:MAG: hypothetical protein HRT90_08840 [Candidatus Margulisbacteria bacterium]|nr:hypothetical protein [Candidatus Margulisiibacteriota bacterium]